MKKVFQFFSIFSITLLLLTSCSSDDSVTQSILVTQITDIATNGATKTTIFNYNGNKIVNAESVDQQIEFTYTDDLITQMIDINLTTLHQNTLDYTYDADELIKITSSDNYIMNFVHNSDNTILYEKKTVDSDGNEVLVYHGKLYFQNYNLTKDERTMDDTPITILSKSEVTYVYDAKNNPFHNITGFTKLLNYFDNISTNNAVNGTKQASINYLDTDQATSSIVTYNNVYQYDGSDYPTEIISEQPVFGSGISGYTMSLFYY